MKIFGNTDKGIVRPANEDSIFFDDTLIIVADGMGGHLAGEIASSDAIKSIRAFFTENATSDKLAAVADAVKYANKNIHEKAKSDPQFRGMGTTVTMGCIDDSRLFYAHVGDSRLYLFRKGRLKKVTNDHSLVAELLNAGQITPEQAETYPNKNIITKAVGTYAEVEPDTGVLELCSGDILLLCSDGLTNMLPDKTIAKTIKDNVDDMSQIADIFIDKANKAGGTDNISVICLVY